MGRMFLKKIEFERQIKGPVDFEGRFSAPRTEIEVRDGLVYLREDGVTVVTSCAFYGVVDERRDETPVSETSGSEAHSEESGAGTSTAREDTIPSASSVRKRQAPKGSR